MTKNQTNGDSGIADVAALFITPNEKGKIKEGANTRVGEEIFVDDVVINIGNHQLTEINGKIVRLDEKGIILQQITQQKYNNILKKKQQAEQVGLDR